MRVFVVGVVVGLAIGGVLGIGWQIREPFRVKSELILPSEPINLQVNLTGIASPPIGPTPTPSPTGVESLFLETLSARARQAIEAARAKTQDASELPKVAAEEFVRGFGDAAKIPKVAVEEFVKGLSGEAGKSVVGFFAELIRRGFGFGDDKRRERQLFSAVVMKELVIFDQTWPASVGVVCHQTKAPSRPIDPQTVLFDPDASVLTADADSVLDQVRESARIHPESVILISGNTDTTGVDQRNRNLAQQRITSVKARLVQAGGVAPSRIFSNELATGSLPVVTGPNRSEPRNRAVTIELRN